MTEQAKGVTRAPLAAMVEVLEVSHRLGNRPERR
jgi:hypothetical protein